jgi:hypothetical protein
LAPQTKILLEGVKNQGFRVKIKKSKIKIKDFNCIKKNFLNEANVSSTSSIIVEAPSFSPCITTSSSPLSTFSFPILSSTLTINSEYILGINYTSAPQLNNKTSTSTTSSSTTSSSNTSSSNMIIITASLFNTNNTGGELNEILSNYTGDLSACLSKLL